MAMVVGMVMVVAMAMAIARASTTRMAVATAMVGGTHPGTGARMVTATTHSCARTATITALTSTAKLG